MKRYCMGRLSLKQAYRFYKVAEYFGRLLFVFMFFLGVLLSVVLALFLRLYLKKNPFLCENDFVNIIFALILIKFIPV